MAKFIEFAIPVTDDREAERLIQINVDQILTVTRNCPEDVPEKPEKPEKPEEPEKPEKPTDEDGRPLPYPDPKKKGKFLGGDEYKADKDLYDRKWRRYDYLVKVYDRYVKNEKYPAAMKEYEAALLEYEFKLKEAATATILMREGHAYKTISTYNEVMVLIDAATGLA